MAGVRSSLVFALCTFLRIFQSSFGVEDPCTQYNSINDSYRSSAYKLESVEKAICDSKLVPGWYRFSSIVGGKIPTIKPEPHYCGTVAPIWMKGTHPTTKGQVTQAIACINIKNRRNGCEITKPLSVKNCGQFFVYNLQPSPACAMAYCAGNLLPCPKGQIGIVPNCRNPTEERNKRQKRSVVSNCELCSSNSSICQLKNDTCKIDGLCFSANQQNPSDWCKQCIPQNNQTAWTARTGNHPPRFEKDQTTRYAIQGEYLPLQLQAKDPDNRPVTYSLLSSTAVGYTFSPTGLLTWNVTTQDNKQFVFKVTDECNASDTINTTLAVLSCHCKNGGTCLPNPSVPRGSGNYMCACPQGFTGAQCENNIDDCLAAKCKNGTCIDGVNNYTCSCHVGFTGSLCDQRLTRCTNQTCFPGVTCKDISNGISCGPCPVGLSGDGKTCVALPMMTTSIPYTSAPTTVATTPKLTTAVPPPLLTTTASPLPTTALITAIEKPTTTQPTTQPTTTTTSLQTTEQVTTTQVTTTSAAKLPQGNITTQPIEPATPQAPTNKTLTAETEEPLITEIPESTPTTKIIEGIDKKCEVRIQRAWRDEYSDVSSKAFKSLSNLLWKEIWSSFMQAKNNNLQKVTVTKFRKGSIIAEFDLIFKSDPEDPLQPIRERIKDGKLGDLEVDPESLKLRDDKPTVVLHDKKPEPKESDSLVLIIVLVFLAILIVIIIVVVVSAYKRRQKRTRNLQRIRNKRSAEDGAPGEMLPLTEKKSSK